MEQSDKEITNKEEELEIRTFTFWLDQFNGDAIIYPKKFTNPLMNAVKELNDEGLSLCGIRYDGSTGLQLIVQYDEGFVAYKDRNNLKTNK